jgi:penicillin-binding protein 1A
MALGAVEVSPMEMAQAYDAFGNGGFKAHGYGIERIRTATGQVLYDHAAALPPKVAVIVEPALSEMDQMLRGVIASGTGARAKIGGYDLAGKTGTTSDYKDAWFIGFTGGFVTAVWVGKDDNTPMRKVTGGGAPAEIWRDFMVAALPRLAAQPIPGGPAPPPVISDSTDATPSDDAQPPDSESPQPEPQAPRGRGEPTPF